VGHFFLNPFWFLLSAMIDGVKSLEFQIVGEKSSSPLELLFFIGDNHILYADRKQALSCPSTAVSRNVS
jgi:hypothetical protein